MVKLKATCLLLMCLLVFSQSLNATIGTISMVGQSQQPEIQALSPKLQAMKVEDFLALTPAKYKQITGERLGWFSSLKLKAAQKVFKKQANKGGEISKGLYIVLAIFGLAWVAMGVMDDWGGSDWIINLLLTFLFWLPGLIHALIKMKKYYK